MRRLLPFLIPLLAAAPAMAQAPLYGIGNGYYPNTGYGSPAPFGSTGYGGVPSYGAQPYGQYGYGQSPAYGAPYAGPNAGYYATNPTYPGQYQPRTPDDVMTPGRVRTDSARPGTPGATVGAAPAVALPGAAAAPVVTERKNPRGQRYEGVAKVVDGNTLILGSEVVVLDGADAPELAQTCTEPSGLEWQCGRRSRDKLVQMVEGRRLVCVGTGFAGQAVAARCSLGPTDVNKAMVMDGWAMVPKAVSATYVADEAAAKADRRGIWSGTAGAPWTFRAKN